MKFLPFKYIIIILTLYIFSSCDENYVPDLICFPKEGGDLTITNYISFVSSIEDSDGNGIHTGGIQPDELIELNYDWLSVFFKEYGDKVTIKAKPNITSRKRVLFIKVLIDNDSEIIRITQN
ncbi:MAG: hypothetical protein K1V78_09055 [Muribaculaceae bacterium]